MGSKRWSQAAGGAAEGTSSGSGQDLTPGSSPHRLPYKGFKSAPRRPTSKALPASSTLNSPKRAWA